MKYKTVTKATARVGETPGSRVAIGVANAIERRQRIDAIARTIDQDILDKSNSVLAK